MRLARKSLRTVYLRRKVDGKDDEGNVITDWADAVPIKVNAQPAGGQVNAAIYGEELAYMKRLLYQGDAIVEGQNENDGVCLTVPAAANPDYTITAIQTYSDHVNVMIKRVVSDDGD
ncbi:MAG TPA: hypothetical protein H9875_08415 [Candidatus Levilactobacillus faecigallinarum]|uniref:Uncharacterized protein n=1 Tax=Candidatus Levilactobacillus faecigallinarum TaxID=2838638 RepID=A0A9D1QTH2_9LACO|nr:hypothetical protein [Candidatus Levilactobacillus faecigallinarum]